VWSVSSDGSNSREPTASAVAADFLAAAHLAAQNVVKEANNENNSGDEFGNAQIVAENHEDWSKMWDQQFQELRDCVNKGNSQEGSIKDWLDEQLVAEALGDLSEERSRRLEALAEHRGCSFKWVEEDAREAGRQQWLAMYRRLRSYRETNGDCLVPLGGSCIDEVLDVGKSAPPVGQWVASLPSLGQWVASQRRAHARGGLNFERIAALKFLDFDWFVSAQVVEGDQIQDLPAPPSWNALYELLRRHRFERGTCEMPRSCESTAGVRIGVWTRDLRTAKREGQLSASQIERLDFLNFNWEASDETDEVKMTMNEIFNLNWEDMAPDDTPDDTQR
jgi:hypothetical protein